MLHLDRNASVTFCTYPPKKYVGCRYDVDIAVVVFQVKVTAGDAYILNSILVGIPLKDPT